MSAHDSTPPVRRSRGPLRWLLDPLSSIWTGVAILAALFIYSALGSSGPWIPGLGFVQIRQWPAFEMTEYEWFHAWPFVALIGLLCLSVTVATLRRIPFKPVNYGVWMIHVGLIVLAVSCVAYFATKLEGDTPVVRRQVRVEVPGYPPASVPAMPGNTVEVGPPDDPYRIQVGTIDPDWEILSGADQGERAFSVNVNVQHGDEAFIRQLLVGYPQYTEDLVRSTEPGGPPWARAKKALGKPLVDETLRMELAYEPQEWFYLSNDLSKNWALYLREIADDGTPGPWVERAIDGLPLYNDYVADLGDVWPSGARVQGPRSLDLEVPARDEQDPLPGAVLRVRSYLRYAFMDARRLPGGELFDPAIRVRVERSDGRGEDYELVAFDAMHRSEPQGRLAFEWIDAEEQLEGLIAQGDPVLNVRVGDAVREVPIRALASMQPDLPFETIEGAEYSFRVQAVHDGLQLPSGEIISVAVVEVRAGDRAFVRWVSDDPTKTRDLPASGDMAAAHSGPMPLDDAIEMTYEPRVGPPTILLVAGPDEATLRLVVSAHQTPQRIEPLRPGQTVSLNESISLRVVEYSPNSRVVEKPFIVPFEQRNTDARARLSMVQVELPGLDGVEPRWLPFHHWPIPDPAYALRVVNLRPTEITTDDGRQVEVIFSRQRRRLPSPVVLEDFAMKTHVGGFTGQNTSILNWTSFVRFDEEGGWGEPKPVSVNDPAEHGGFWYFQAQWDPPDPEIGYRGLNYTVLGVGNRHGVNAMLLGCCVMTIGMIYAFYVKPVIKRRRQQAVRAELGAGKDNGELVAVGERLAAAVPAAAEETR